MISFNDDEITRLIKKYSVILNLSYVSFAVTLVSAVIAAALTKGAYADGANWEWYITSLIFALAFLVIFITLVAGFLVRESKRLKDAVCKRMCEGLLAKEEFFRGGEEIEFVTVYSNDCFIISRKGYTGEISIDPSRQQDVQNLGVSGAKIQLDLAPLKPAAAVYGIVGTRLWLFLQAYYSVHGEEIGVKRVLVTDCMGKEPLVLDIVRDGVPVKSSENNYFIKKGLIK